MLFLAMANWEQNEQFTSLIMPVTTGYVMILQSLICLGQLHFSCVLNFHLHQYKHTGSECGTHLLYEFRVGLFQRVNSALKTLDCGAGHTNTSTNMLESHRIYHINISSEHGNGIGGSSGVTSHSWGEVLLLSLDTVQLITTVTCKSCYHEGKQSSQMKRTELCHYRLTANLTFNGHSNIMDTDTGFYCCSSCSYWPLKASQCTYKVGDRTKFSPCFVQDYSSKFIWH